MSKNKEHKQTDGILVNRLNFKVNEVEFNKRYTILHAEYSKDEVRKTKDEVKKIKDEVRNEAVRHLSKFHTVKAIRYEYGGTSFYVLLKGNSEKDKIIKTLNSIVLNNPVKEENYSQVAPDIVFELLLIGLSYNDADKEDDGNNLSYSNLDGGVYTFEPEDIYKGDRVVTFNLKARPAKDCVDLFGKTQMLFPAQTFASVAKMNETEADRKYLKDLPKFQMVDNTYMKLSKGAKFGSGVEYVKHGYRGMPKASIDFLGISSVDEFDKSKMGRTRLTLRKMRREYADIGLEVEFVRTYLFDGNKYTKKNPGFTKDLTDLWGDKKINIIDKVKSPTSESIVKGVSMELKALFNVDTVPSEDVVKDEYNLVVIQKKIRDPNHKYYDDAMVQHISVESFAKKYHRKDPAGLKTLHEEIQSGKIHGNRRNSLEMWLSEFIIKGDIINNTQTFFGWYKEHLMNVEPVSTLDRTWRFYDRVRIENTDPEHRMEAKYSDKMGCLEMNPNGKMSYRIIEEAEVKEDFGLLQLIWNQFNRNQSNIKGVMSDGENTYAFLSTDVKMIPELDSIRQKLRDNEKNHANDKSVSLTGGIKTKSDYELYLKACTDVRYAYVKNECYYFVGVRSEDIKFGLYWSAGLLKIKTLEGREKIPEVVFDMMLVPFVRLNRFTIVPYPFKYLREFEKTKGLENYVPEEPSEEETGKDSEYQWTLDKFDLI